MIDDKTEIGKWFRSKNAVEKIGDRIFLHGGISAQINKLKLSLKELNEKCRLYYVVPSKDMNEEAKLFLKSNGPFW